MQTEINRNFIKQLPIPFEDALTPPKIADIAELAGLSPGATANGLHGRSTSPPAVAAGVSAVRSFRNLLNRFLDQFPPQFIESLPHPED